ncbi:hypothetical protein BJX61DRAFT_533580 [Aspergillus egyptiacus]|nr:hypothetical protein BJX61DRAFT_533580 [Aspergillus egyptiacus]
MARTYSNPAAIITICILFPVLGTFTVVLRFFARKRAKKDLWVDDWLCLPALFLELVLAALLIWGATTSSLGGQLPPPTVPGPNGYLFSTSDEQIRLQQIQYFADLAAILAFGFTKLSVLFFYRSIFCSRRVTKTPFHTVTLFMIALVIVWTVVFGFGAIFLCGGNPSYAWAPVAVVAEKCKLQLPLLEGYAISDFIMDVLIWALPLPRIWALNMSLRQKIGLTLVFLVGLLAIAASATRMAIYIDHVVNAFAESDGETLITYLLFWTMIECGLGVIVICLPALRPLYRNISLDSLTNSIMSTWPLRSLATTTGTGSHSVVTRPESLDGSVNSTASWRLSRTWHNGRTKTSIVAEHDVLMSENLRGQKIYVRDEVELH